MSIELSKEKRESILNKVKDNLKGIEKYSYFFMGSPFPEIPYYLYFNDSNTEIRRYSLAVFAIKLKYWETQCSFEFANKASELRTYIKAIIQHSEQIEKDFPYIFQLIVDSLVKIGEINRYSETTSIDRDLYNYAKRKLLDSKRHLMRDPYSYSDFLNFLKDLKITPTSLDNS